MCRIRLDDNLRLHGGFQLVCLRRRVIADNDLIHVTLACSTMIFPLLFPLRYRLMYPLSFIDLTIFPPEQMVNPLWETEEKLHMKLYLSAKEKFGRSFLESEFAVGGDSDTVLLWKQDIEGASLSKSFLLSSLDCVLTENSCDAVADDSLKHAQEWLDHTEKILLEQDAGIIATIQSAGQGVESTSILLTFYQAVSDRIAALLNVLHPSEGLKLKSTNNEALLERSNIYLAKTSPIWRNLMSNSSVHVHVIVTRQEYKADDAVTPDEALAALGQASRTHSLLTGHVSLVKFDEPNHLSKPGRLLYRDVVHFVMRVLGQVDASTRPPWDMAYFNPEYHMAYQHAQLMKEQGAGYPYWKPEVAVKYLIDTDSYPYDMAHVSGMSFVQVAQSTVHPVGIAHIPALHVDEIGLTSEKYIPLNQTVSSLPLHITFDRSDMKQTYKTQATTATAGGISPARWRLLNHLSQSIESQKQLGFEQSDIDDLRRLIADTNVTLLGITVLASALHLLFEFLTFKNEVSFWKNNTDLTGLSVRSLFLDMIGQFIIVLYLIEKDSSLLMIVPSGVGCLIALWKCQRAAGLAFVKAKKEDQPAAWWNKVFRLFGYEVCAVRLQQMSDDCHVTEGDQAASDKVALHSLSMECDRIATKRLGVVFLPMVIAYAFYSLMWENHSGWYSWLITSASSAVYALGFVLMTPQL